MSRLRGTRRGLAAAVFTVGLVLTLQGLGDAKPKGVARSEVRIRFGKDGRTGPRSALERFRKVGSGNKGTKRRRSPSTSRIEGRLVEGGSGEILLERVVDPATAKKLQRMGFRKLDPKEQPLHKTLRGNKIYLLYAMDKAVYAPKAPERLVGSNVKIEVKHARDGSALVTSIKRER